MSESRRFLTRDCDVMATHTRETESETSYWKFSRHDFSRDPSFQEGWSKVSQSLPAHLNIDAELLKSKLFYFGRLHGSTLSVIGYKDWLVRNMSEKSLENVGHGVPSVNDTEDAKNLHSEVHQLSGEGRLSESDESVLATKLTTQANLQDDVGYLCLDLNTKPHCEEVEECGAKREDVINTERDKHTGTLQACQTAPVVHTLNGGQGSDHSVIPDVNNEQKLSFHQLVQLIEDGETLPGTLELNIQPTNRKPTISSLPRVAKPWET